MMTTKTMVKREFRRPPVVEPEPELFEQASTQTRLAREFLDSFGVGEGDRVVMVSCPVNAEIPREVLRRGAGLVLVDKGDDGMMLSREALGGDIEHPNARVMQTDFTGLDVEHAKLVFVPGVLDDPKCVDQESIIEKACQLAAGGGYIAFSFDSQEDEMIQLVVDTAAERGFSLTPHEQRCYNMRYNKLDSRYVTETACPWQVA